MRLNRSLPLNNCCNKNNKIRNPKFHLHFYPNYHICLVWNTFSLNWTLLNPLFMYCVLMNIFENTIPTAKCFKWQLSYIVIVCSGERRISLESIQRKLCFYWVNFFKYIFVKIYTTYTVMYWSLQDAHLFGTTIHFCMNWCVQMYP